MAAILPEFRSTAVLAAGFILTALLHCSSFAQSPSSVAPGFPIVTGFSGPRANVAPLPPGVNPADKITIDLDGPSLRVIDTSNMGGPPQAQAVPAPKLLTITAAQIGQVFALTLDDATPPNIYAAATSAYGLPIVTPDADGDGLPDRARKGAANAQFMPGLFGPADIGGGPGSIWRIDGRTGAVSLFANVMLDGVPNSGLALGGIAFDPASRQIFVSDRDTGMVHRFGLDSRELGRFDHGVQALPTVGLPPFQFDPGKRLDIGNHAFDSESPPTWGYAPPSRRVFGLAVYRGRLYYAVAAGIRIWSVSIGADGSFGQDARVEYAVPNGPVPGTEISKIIFDDAGNMLLAERGGPTGAYNFGALTAQNAGRVIRLQAQQPGANGTPFLWSAAGDYAIGFSPIFQNGDGGIAIGYGYDPSGLATASACGGTLWTTGSQLRISPDPSIAQRLAPGGPFPIDGLQGTAVPLLRPQNTPPFGSYFVDFDDRTDIAGTPGHMGDVVAWRACPPTPQVVEFVPQILELGLEDVGCPAGSVRSRQQCIPTPCREDEVYRNGKCDKPECVPSQLTRGDMCCPKGMQWNPRERTCQPRERGKPDLEIVKELYCPPRGTNIRGNSCYFVIRVTNIGDAPYTGPIVVGDFMMPGNSGLTGPAGWICGPVPVQGVVLPPGTPSIPPGTTATACLNPNATLQPNESVGFQATGPAPGSSRTDWRNCAVVVGDPNKETNWSNNRSCVKNEENPKPSCPDGMILTLRGGCCTAEAIATGTCASTPPQPPPPTAITCPFPTFLVNGTCCTREAVTAGSCGGTPPPPTTVSCPFPTFLVNGTCCTREAVTAGSCGGTLVNCPPGSRSCNPPTGGDCPGGARRVDGQCPSPTTGGCKEGQFRGDNGQCQNRPTGDKSKSCPKGSSWNGEACAKDRSTEKPGCRTGTHAVGSRCVADNKKNTKQIKDPGRRFTPPKTNNPKTFQPPIQRGGSPAGLNRRR